MGNKLLTVGQENSIFNARQFKRMGPGKLVLQGPSWASLGRKYDVSPATVQGAWRRANLRDKNN